MHREWSEADKPLWDVVGGSGFVTPARRLLLVLSAVVLILGLASPANAQSSSATRNVDSPVVEPTGAETEDDSTGSKSDTLTPITATATDSRTVGDLESNVDSPAPGTTPTVSEAVAGSPESLAISSIDPSIIFRSGGTQITIEGLGFSEVTRIALDGEVVTDWSAIDDSRIQATLPPIPMSLTTVVVALISSTTSVTWTLDVIDDTPALEPVEDSRGFIVKYRNRGAALGALAATADALDVPGLDLTAIKSIAPNVVSVQPSEPLTPQEAASALAELRADPRIESADPNFRIEPMIFPETPPNDDYWNANQWSLWDTYGIGIGDGPTTMATAWQESQGEGVVVAVLDTGYTVHPDMPSYPSGQWVAGYDFVSSFTNPALLRYPAPSSGIRSMVDVDGDYIDEGVYGPIGWDDNPLDSGDWNTESSFWHGTLVAGQVAALTNNTLGVAAAAPAARVQPVRVLSWNGGYLDDLEAAIEWASGGTVDTVTPNATPADVINLSLGATRPEPCPATLQTVINGAIDRGTVVVAAAGNSATDASQYFPANCAGVIVVGGTGQDGKRADYGLGLSSNFGSTVDIAAPSLGIWGLYNDGTTTPGTPTYASASGTSFASPLGAAVAAMLKSWNPALTPAQIETIIVGNSRSFAGGSCDTDPSKSCGSGIVDSSAALAATAPGTAGTSLSIRSGDTQTARAGAAVSLPMTVTVLSASGSPLRDVTVTYAVASGGGSVVDSSAITDANGIATLGAWTLGPAAGANTLRATISGTITSVVFTAEGTSPPSPPSPEPPSPTPDAPSGGGSTAPPDTGAGTGGGVAPVDPLGPTAALTSIGAGQVVAQVGGVQFTPQVKPTRNRLSLEVTGTGFGVTVRAMEFGGGGAELSPAGALRIQPGQEIQISGFGYAPGTVVQVYASRPLRALGAFAVAADGTIEVKLAVPADLVSGPGGLQVNGVAAGGAIRSLTFGVEVRTPALVNGTKLRTTVYFPAGSIALSSAQEEKLRRLLAQVPRNSAVSVLARGFAPKRVPAGDAPAARARAESVLEYLDSIGLSGQTYASGTGRTGKTGKQARRVAVTLTYRELPMLQAL